MDSEHNGTGKATTFSTNRSQ